jgi:SAM-dependent methyltransferase
VTVLIEPVPFQPRRFRTAAHHYLAGRPGYAARAIARVIELCAVKPTDRMLDLGCGPGQLARAFAPCVGEIVGVDPEPEMLRLAREGAPDNALWIEASSYDIGPHLGRFGLVTMGRSFHWMDRVDTLRRLDEIVTPGGAVVLFSDSHPDVPDNAWRAEYSAVIERFAGDEERRRRRGPGWISHTALLLDSAFSAVEEISVIERRTLTAGRLLDRALSMSSTSRARLGPRADDLLRDLTDVIERLAPSGHLREVVATNALMARRPSTRACQPSPAIADVRRGM